MLPLSESNLYMYANSSLALLAFLTDSSSACLYMTYSSQQRMRLIVEHD